MVRHGGCLGLGLAAMGTHRQDVYEQLKFNLYQDDACTGEAAGIAMGMVMLGSKNASAIEDMVAVSHLFLISIGIVQNESTLSAILSCDLQGIDTLYSVAIY